jgi:two-component system response regulator YesN
MSGRVIVVEDEVWFRRGLVQLIEQSELGWIVVGEAANGEEAMRLISAGSPDLVVTDIEMPLMNGLELAEQLHNHPRQPEVIIVTGHKDFQYAQTAIRFGVREFLLKPCTEEEIVFVLRQAYERFRKRRDAEKQVRTERKWSVEHAMRSLLHQLPTDSEIVNQLKQECVGREMWMLEVQTFFPKHKTYRNVDQGLLHFAILNIAGEIIQGSEQHFLLIAADYSRLVLFIQPSAFIAGLLDRIISIVNQLLGLEMRCERLATVKDMDEISRLYARYRNRSQDDAQVMDIDSPDLSTFRYYREKLDSQWMAGAYVNLKECFQEAVTTVLEIPLKNARLEALSMARALDEAARKQFAEAGELYHTEQWVEQLRIIEKPSELRVWLETQTRLFEAAYQEWQQRTNDHVIEKALRYIHDNYATDCSMAAAAEYVHLNATYFSELFKKKTGAGFSSFVTRFRMEKARGLLIQTSMRIAEIASTVGYSDSNYFTNVFRQTHLMSPSDYRKKHLN